MCKDIAHEGVTDMCSEKVMPAIVDWTLYLESLKRGGVKEMNLGKALKFVDGADEDAICDDAKDFIKELLHIIAGEEPVKLFEFKVRDIVKVGLGAGRPPTLVGKVGKVIAMEKDSAPIGVEFQEKTGSGHGCKGIGRLNYCYWLCKDDVELVYRPLKEDC